MNRESAGNIKNDISFLYRRICLYDNNVVFYSLVNTNFRKFGQKIGSLVLIEQVRAV